MIEKEIEDSLFEWLTRIVAVHEDSALGDLQLGSGEWSIYRARNQRQVEESSRIVLFADERLPTGIERCGNYSLPVEIMVITHFADETIGGQTLDRPAIHARRVDEINTILGYDDPDRIREVSREINSVATGGITVTGYKRDPQLPSVDAKDRTIFATTLRVIWDVCA